MELCYARLTGVTYCLNSTPMLRRLWRAADVLSLALRALCEAFRAPLVRDKFQVRLLSLTQSIVNAREVLSSDAAFNSHIVDVREGAAL